MPAVTKMTASRKKIARPRSEDVANRARQPAGMPVARDPSNISRARTSAIRPLAMEVLEQFRLIYRSAKKHFQWIQQQTGVSGAQLWVMAEVHRRPGIRVTDLARALAVHQSTASNLIEGLSRLGLIARNRSSDDQRVVHVTLKPAGLAIVTRAPLPLEGVLPDALAALEQADLAELKQCLDKLTTHLKVRDRAGKRIPLAEI